MRTRVLFVSLAVGVLCFLPTSLLGQKKTNVSQLSLRQKIESEVFNLQRNLKKAKNLKDRFRSLEKSEQEIRSLRRNAPRQNEPDENYFDQLLAAYEQIPRSDRFKEAECADYQAQILAKLEPKATAEPQSPAVRSGLLALSQICRKTP